MTHTNLYDGTVEGLRWTKPVFCVQYIQRPRRVRTMRTICSGGSSTKMGDEPERAEQCPSELISSAFS